MQIEASITFTYTNDVQPVVEVIEEEVEVELNDEDYDADDDADDDDDDDDNDGVDNSIDSYSDISSSSNVSLIVLEDLDVALQEYVNNDNDNIAIRLVFLIFSVSSNILNNINIFYYHTILRRQENYLLNFQYPGKLLN